MQSRRPGAVAVVLLWATSAIAAPQAPVGPVSPKPSTLGAYEKSLDTLLQRDSDDRLWAASGQTERGRLLKAVQQLTIEIYGLPIGPVVPKVPPPPPPTLTPTKSIWDDAFKSLRTALQRASGTAPQHQVPVATATELQMLIDRLTAVRPN